MAISRWGCYDYQAVLHADREGLWAGVADEGEDDCLLGSGPSVAVSNGRVTLTRLRRGGLDATEISQVDFDGGEALNTVLRGGDRLGCWRGSTAEIGVSVSRGGSLVLGLGALDRTPAGDITIDHDPRAGDSLLAADIRFIERPGTRIVWLDPDKPSELEAQRRELDGDIIGVKSLAFVARTDDESVCHELNRRTMQRSRRGVGGVFLNAPERFSSLEEWLQYGRALPPERPRDLWIRVRIGTNECLVPEGTTAMVEGARARPPRARARNTRTGVASGAGPRGRRSQSRDGRDQHRGRCQRADLARPHRATGLAERVELQRWTEDVA